MDSSYLNLNHDPAALTILNGVITWTCLTHDCLQVSTVVGGFWFLPPQMGYHMNMTVQQLKVDKERRGEAGVQAEMHTQKRSALTLEVFPMALTERSDEDMLSL